MPLWPQISLAPPDFQHTPSIWGYSRDLDCRVKKGVMSQRLFIVFFDQILIQTCRVLVLDCGGVFKGLLPVFPFCSAALVFSMLKTAHLPKRNL